MHIVIRAGGVGTRLWPVSRSHRPKQLHALTGTKTLLQESVDRVLDIVPKENIYVSCNRTTEAAIRKELESVLEHNYIVEPALRDTAAAVGLETVLIARDNPDAIIASLGSDHVITDTAEFQRVLQLAETTIQSNPDSILCIGIAPEQPDTGYGYIELDGDLEAATSEVFAVKSFKEKPDMATAKQFLEAGNYLWNANMFVWKASTVLRLFEQHQPEMYAQLMKIHEDLDCVPEVYPTMEKIAIDYAIIEKTDNILAIPGTFGWNDIGDWARLKDELCTDDAETVSRGNHLDHDSSNMLVYSNTDRLITTIGLNNVVIVDTGDALLVCDKNRSQEVKDIVDRLKNDNQEHLT